MKYDDLEKTQDLFDLEDDVPTPIEDIIEEGVNKDNLTTEEPIKEEIKENKKKDKKSFKDKWKSLSKKKKIIIIISMIIVLMGIILLTVFLLKKDPAKENEENKNKEPVVIIEEENYKYEDGILVFLDSNKNELGKYECQNKDEKLCYVANYNEEDEFDGPKNLYVDNTPVKRRSIIYLDNYVFINDSKEEEILLYNIKNEKVEDTYKLVKGFRDSNYVILKDKNNKYGLILFENDKIVKKIDFAYQYIGMATSTSNVVVLNNDKYYIYDLNGKVLSKDIAYQIKSYNNKYIVVDNDGYYVFDYKNNLILDDKADYMSLLDDYVVIISDEKLYIKDYNNNKYNEEKIKLNSKDYNMTNIYDSNNKLVDTKWAYQVLVDSTGINITYNKNNEKNKTINPYEGKLNSSLAFINYFDGKLYIYNDEDKTNLIGTYTCSNKNNIQKDTKELTNCKIAKESFYSKNEMNEDNSLNVGLMPVVNDRYIFITDSIDKNSETISLYDLKNNKTLVKYGSIDAGIYSKESNLTFLNVEELYVMAQNRNNKYGVIKIDQEVGGVVTFNYVGIEKLGDYYLGIGSQNSYVLIDKKGKEVTEKIGRRIESYLGNYLKTYDGNKYYVCNFKGETNDNTGYLDITLSDDYYVFITTEYKLGIGKYDDPEFKLSHEIEIGSNYKNNYKVTKDESGYTINVLSTNETFKADINGMFLEDILQIPEE